MRAQRPSPNLVRAFFDPHVSTLGSHSAQLQWAVPRALVLFTLVVLFGRALTDS